MHYNPFPQSSFPCSLQDRVEEVQAALEELALEKERLLRRNADLQAELQARTAPSHLGRAQPAMPVGHLKHSSSSSCAYSLGLVAL